MTRELGIPVDPAPDARSASLASDVCVTCTPSREPLLFADDVRPGTFVAAVGADHPEKQELDPELLRRATVVVDIRDQCAAMGELHHALARGLLSSDAVHAELAEVVSGRKVGRRNGEETTIFDSTGTALQDVAAAAAVYREALRNPSHGMRLTLAS
jgi:ornithine cyclodeaminase/alanine dehydrogenase-like protein (mu-crystallin family)